MNKFFLKIALLLSLLAGPINALLITPTARKVDTRVKKAEAEHKTACLAELLMIQLADLSAEKISQLPTADKPNHRFSKARLPSPLISLIGQYVVGKDVNGIKLPPACCHTEYRGPRSRCNPRTGHSSSYPRQ